jgi:hypothetical protein
MPFGGQFDVYYELIYKPAVAGVGLRPIRADSLFGSRAIIQDIWALTKTAAVILADLTSRNPNVFYELGLAHALGKPVCLVSNTTEDIPFDLRHLRVTLYTKDHPAWGEELKSEVQKSLASVLENPEAAGSYVFLESHVASSSLNHQDYADSFEYRIPNRELAEKLAERAEFAAIVQMIGKTHGTRLVEYVLDRDLPGANQFIGGFGFAEAKKAHVLQTVKQALDYLAKTTLIPR